MCQFKANRYQPASWRSRKRPIRHIWKQCSRSSLRWYFCYLYQWGSKKVLSKANNLAASGATERHWNCHECEMIMLLLFCSQQSVVPFPAATVKNTVEIQCVFLEEMEKPSSTTSTNAKPDASELEKKTRAEVVLCYMTCTRLVHLGIQRNSQLQKIEDGKIEYWKR